ncbi:lytic transglycosylase domain-containing protein [Phyllobacterium sp. 0TCS1.6C]|uniref:lytic transglycosylase domain-containing protein n=1 Tax=unclassified Phyllobacterium TaxID=2638441 RepID=UPI0022655512|nr:MULTISPECIES: lytic transglycosylase domain-containing protein [unclassified Phyllobacterium]MCX8280567.1 lytic transglycosylase domain-containing protein [Phyllobacterium sp. 0TCS1.6C]MCX8294984.1 lytic transglycosylase domain-containing protein [Phyllobacterium sp. 0TCS1.6A]
MLRKLVLRSVILGFGLPAAALTAHAQAPTPPAAVPVPTLKPFAPTQTRVSPAIQAVTPPDPVTTSAIKPPSSPTAVAGSLKSGLDALSSGDVRRALAIRNGLPQNALDRHILTWAIGLSNAPGLPSSEIARAAAELPGWPGMATFRSNSERALFKENPPAATVINAFGNTRPQTPEGMIILARAHVANGDTARARQVLGPFWRTRKLDDGQEAAILKEFSQVIAREDHLMRMLTMLYEGKVKSAGRVAGLSNAESLYQAFAAVLKKSPDAGKKLAAVHESWKGNPAYIFAKAQYLRRQEKFKEAADVINTAPRNAAALVDPDAWWTERRVLSRELLDIGDAKRAYRVAAMHVAETPVVAADAEFHAGWYALRALRDARTAHRHFARIAELSSRPMSASRAYYWLGRAAEAGAGGNSRDYYARAAHYGTTFYGQLAAAKLGQTGLQLPYPRPTDAERNRFAQREAVRAIQRLEQAGYDSRAALLYSSLAQELDSPGELALLAVMAERKNNHFVALRVGKAAAQRGIDVGALSHPIGAIPENANISGSGAALAYAIARQESEFNPGAVSSAGARGLLQLLPGTAKGVATRAGMSYSQSRLTTDAAYNATLGAKFLGEQIAKFDGSYVLTFAGYNAGPTRANEWKARYGDPRGKSVEEVVDWIERIPYTETRNYVQRVMENYQVYKARLTGKARIESDLTAGRS